MTVPAEDTSMIAPIMIAAIEAAPTPANPLVFVGILLARRLLDAQA